MNNVKKELSQILGVECQSIEDLGNNLYRYKNVEFLASNDVVKDNKRKVLEELFDNKFKNMLQYFYGRNKR